MNMAAIIRHRKQSRHARGEGIRNTKAWRRTQAELLVDVLLRDMERGLCADLESNLAAILPDASVADRERIEEAW